MSDSYDPRCRTCGAPLRWARTARGRPIPLNREPDPEGNVVFATDGQVETLAKGAERPGETRYMPHHASCPEGRLWRR